MDETCEQALAMAAKDTALSDDAFVMIRRVLAGLDPETGERPELELPARMLGRGWRRSPMERVEVGRYAGWWWRCPRKSCDAWGGPFRDEWEATSAGRKAHHDAHVPGKPDKRK